jgi:hypothetical protein
MSASVTSVLDRAVGGVLDPSFARQQECCFLLRRMGMKRTVPHMSWNYYEKRMI